MSASVRVPQKGTVEGAVFGRTPEAVAPSVDETPVVTASDTVYVCMSGNPCGGAAVREPEQEKGTFITFV